MRKNLLFFSFVKIKTMSTKTTKTSTKTKRATKTKEVEVEQPEPVVQEVVEVPVTVQETVVETPVETPAEVDQSESMRNRFERLVKTKTDLITELKKEIQELRKMQKDHEHAVRDALKKSKRKKAPRDDSVPRKPSGFASPVTVSTELYTFLEQFGVKNGDPIARTDVTRHITSYIKQHELQNPEHRREIVPDAALNKLFGPPMELKDPEDEGSPKIYTYLKLQKYLSPHFPKKQ